MEHCAAVEARRKLTIQIQRAIGQGPGELSGQGTEEELLFAFSELEGIVAEFTDGGDEMAEGCTCDNRDHIHGHEDETFRQIMDAFTAPRDSRDAHDSTGA